jgi:hypothetical protein
MRAPVEVDALYEHGPSKGGNVSEQYHWFVGIDWVTENHEVCIVDCDGGVVDRKTIERAHYGGIVTTIGKKQQ